MPSGPKSEKLEDIDWERQSEWGRLELALKPLLIQTGVKDSSLINIGFLLKDSIGWSLNGNGTNFSGFNALPGGLRSSSNKFESIGSEGYWWSFTSEIVEKAICRGLDSDGISIYWSDFDKDAGLSIRCIKD